jgi:phospholipase C
MNDTTRRDFFKLSATFAGAAGLAGLLPDSIRRAAAIDPAPGSTFLDAEHVVILMQENRSFDHAYGTLRGVRGFSDPRAITLPDGNPVWVQPDGDGRRYAPFRMDIQQTSATWTGCIPHSWTDQTDARNGGRYDAWIPNKRSGDDAYAAIPLTMGHYTRADIPFYYELADAFTVCDQHFCSSLTGTTPNRCHLWSGTIRHEPSPQSKACVLNSDADYGSEVSWTTFPDRLEDLGVSWRIYQNEISMATGLTSDEDGWLGNFTDNPIEFFSQFHVRFHPKHREYLKTSAERCAQAVDVLEKELKEARLSPKAREVVQRDLERRVAELNDVQEQLSRWTAENFNKLSQREKNLHTKAFATNTGDPDYRSLTELTYEEGGQQRMITAPKGDIFHQFRQDVERGELPTVSWLVAPERFSDHPCSAWFGAWYIAEALDILTKNPEVWKKTIFILTYDENDGYFDHVPPFVAPHVDRPETGRTSPGATSPEEYITLEEDMRYKSREDARDSSIGLGYRVPLVIASPWSRGGCVCSQVFDHTSPLQLMEKWLTHKLGKPVQETNISAWRRAVCGDLTSAFQPATDEPQKPLEFPPRDAFIEQIARARHKNPPDNYHALTPEEIEEIRRDGAATPLLARQEPGTRPSAPLPYEPDVAEGVATKGPSPLVLAFAAGNTQFGDRSAGVPFTAYARTGDDLEIRNYAVAPGEIVRDEWPLVKFRDEIYQVAVYGPNGFYREFRGDTEDGAVHLRFEDRRDGRGAMAAVVHATNHGRTPERVTIADVAYGNPPQTFELPPGATISSTISAQQSAGWYDLRVTIAGREQFERRYAGRIETGRWSTSDPQMGRV